MITTFGDPFDALLNLQKALEAHLTSDWLEDLTTSRGTPNQPPPLLRPGGKLGCGGAIMSQRTMNGVSVPMTQLARSLSMLVGRTVIDKTGLTANLARSQGAPVGGMAGTERLAGSAFIPYHSAYLAKVG